MELLHSNCMQFQIKYFYFIVVVLIWCMCPHLCIVPSQPWQYKGSSHSIYKYSVEFKCWVPRERWFHVLLPMHWAYANCDINFTKLIP